MMLCKHMSSGEAQHHSVKVFSGFSGFLQLPHGSSEWKKKTLLKKIHLDKKLSVQKEGINTQKDG